MNKFFCLPIIFFLLTLIYITLYFVMLKLNIFFFWIMYTLYKREGYHQEWENRKQNSTWYLFKIGYLYTLHVSKKESHTCKKNKPLYSSLLVWCVFFSSTIYILALVNIHVDLVVTYTDHKSNKRWGKMFLIAFVTCFILVRENGQQNCHDDQETEVYRF